VGEPAEVGQVIEDADMPRVRSQLRWRVLGFGCLAAVAWCPFASSDGWPEAALQPPADRPGLTKLYFGIQACKKCHSEGIRNDPEALCTCEEFPIWFNKDKHPLAYKALLPDSPRAKAMGEILGYKPHEAQACIVCHGVYTPPKEQRDPTFSIEDGVSCVACHGPYAEWVERHSSTLESRRQQWRKLSRAEKERQAGMTDLWDPAKRDQLCASCHVGSSAEGKVVTHEMYAAGHPPLPSFEIATFSEQMPKHWQYLWEKPKRVQELLGYAPNRLEQTELVVVGGVASFHETLALTAGEATKRTQAKESEGRALDFALFDCASCHHDLKRDSWRQKRGYPGSPGRPQMPNWPLAILRVAVSYAAANDAKEKQARQELDTALGQLAHAYDVQPFGEPGTVESAAKALAQWSDGLRASLAKGTYDKAAALRILHQLAAEPARSTPDFESARQLAWAFEIVYQDYCREGKEVKTDPAVNAVVRKLKADLNLELPSGKERKLLDFLRASLERQAAYDPEPVKKAFAQLTKLLPAK
jgi:Cytochrome c554 and c-prime